MASLFRSFMEAMAPPHQIPEGQRSQTTVISGGSQPKESREPRKAGSKTALEWRRVRGDPNSPQDDHEVEVEDLGPDSEDEVQYQGNPLDPGDLPSQITVRKPRSTPIPQLQDQSGLEDSETPQTTGEEESLSSLHMGDLLKDAKFYQDIAIELQTAYETLESRFTQQAHLMEEASGALHDAESQASKRQQELLRLQKDREADIQLSVGKAVFDYKEQLAAAKHKQQSKDCKHQQTVHQLQDQVHTLELLLASHATLPSVRHTQKEADL